MLARFCLYGFLKNQQYFEPFLILAFREKGLSFTVIGALIGFREICINLLEVPTGAIADVVGRRRSMILSFLAYILAFLAFALAQHLAVLFLAMFAFAIGEAFRTGTHKAIIFAWLSREGRTNEKTRIYGLTRSWSKLGSAVSVVIAAFLVFFLTDYSWVFLFAVVPYAINIINFILYPAYLDEHRTAAPSLTHVWHTLKVSIQQAFDNRPLRSLLTQSMCFEGSHKVAKDYLQPLLKTYALALPLLAGYAHRQRTAVLVGAVYLVLYLLSSYASRRSDCFLKWAGSSQKATGRLWILFIVSSALITIGILFGMAPLAIAAFVSITIIQNFWRPILVSEVAAHSSDDRMATILSIESQAKSLFTAIVAPLLGVLVDYARAFLGPERQLLPVGLVGLFVAGIWYIRGARDK